MLTAAVVVVVVRGGEWLECVRMFLLLSDGVTDAQTEYELEKWKLWHLNSLSEYLWN